MPAFELPIGAAKARLLPSGDAHQHTLDLLQADHTRRHGTALAAGVLASALDGFPHDRIIGQRSRTWGPVQTVARGWLLHERLREEGDHARYYRLGGLMLSHEAQIYAYSGRVSTERSTGYSYVTGADGRDVRTLPVDGRDDALVVCRDISALNLLHDQELDERVGAIAGSLTLEDLLAGLVVNRGIDMPQIEVPMRLVDGPGTLA